jgi:hypothetical protein
MPSMLHESLLQLFRNRPTLAAELLRDTLGVPIPPFTEARVEEADLTQVLPTEYRADLVVILRHGAPVFGIVVEAQLAPDDDKPFTWPHYGMALRAKLRCPVCVLVITHDPKVAEWASQRIDTGQPGVPFFPVVLGPRAVPRVTTPAEAERAPELAVLSVLAHGREERGLEMALATLTATSGLDEERAMFYLDLVRGALNDSARRALESMMSTGNYQLQDPESARKLLDFTRRLREEGKVEGKAEGEAKGKAEALLHILATRGLAVSDSDRDRILSCTDLATLDRWIDRAIRASTMSDVMRSTE